MNSQPKKEDSLNVKGTTFTFGDIQKVIDQFYERVETHRHLKIPFSSVEDWPSHKAKLAHFWWIRFGGDPYMDIEYNLIQKHYETGYNEEFLEMWLTLFKEVLTSNLNQDQAKLWQMFAEGIGNALNFHHGVLKKLSALSGE